MSFLFFTKKVLSALILPPLGPLILIAVGLGLINRRPKLGRVFAWGGVLLLLALSLPVVSWALMKAVEDGPSLDFQSARRAQAIVILSGGGRPGAIEYGGGSTLNALGLERARYGAFVARRTGLPVLVTGGGVYGGKPEANLMKDVLEKEFGIEVRWLDAAARDTHENAVNSERILKRDGIHRIILVTHGFDMRRARGEFEAAGMEVIAAPTVLPSGDFNGFRGFLPSVNALLGSYYALYEMVGEFARKTGILGWFESEQGSG